MPTNNLSSLRERANNFLKKIADAFSEETDYPQFKTSSSNQETIQEEAEVIEDPEFVKEEEYHTTNDTASSADENLFFSCSFQEALTLRIVKHNEVSILEELLTEYEEKGTLQKLKVLFQNNKPLAIWMGQNATANMICRMPFSIWQIIQKQVDDTL